MAKILFVNPVVREEDDPKHIPYGIALLAAVAIEKGHEVQVYDANAWRKSFSILEQVYTADEWDVIAIGGLTTTYGFIKEAVKMAKKFSPNSYIISGGGFLTSMPREIMEWLPEIDLGVVGEAFITFPEVLKQIDEKNFDFSKTQGVCFRHPKNGMPILTESRPLLKDLDCLPYPAYELFPLDIYFGNSSNLLSEENYASKKRLDVCGSYGCGLICKYCWHLGTTGDMVIEKDEEGNNDVVFSYGRTIRYHSPRYIVNLVKGLYEKYDLDFASFIDENFMTMDAYSRGTWLKEICRLWLEEGLQPTCRQKGIPHDEHCKGVHWGGTAHAGLHKPETLALMFEAGCSQLVYGLETFDPGILKNLGKGSTRARNISSVGICLESGITPIPNIIIGFPEETFDSVRNTIEALNELKITAKPHFATPYPGSEWYYTYKESIKEQYNGDLEAYILDLGDATKITGVISHNFSPMELLGLQEMVYHRDLVNLERSQKHWESMTDRKRYAYPKTSFNMRSKKLKAPVEPEARAQL